MVYSDFTLRQLQKEFGLKSTITPLFPKVTPLQPDDFLKKAIQLAKQLPLQSEKAKSELIVMPVLLDLLEKNEQFFTIYSGNRLEVDQAKGLVGECDFIVARNTKSYDINLPLLMMVEAKKDNVDYGMAQCAAQMLGAKIYNDTNEQALETIYGCVTTGEKWHFLKLKDSILFVDEKRYYWNQLNTLLGVLQSIINEYKVILLQ